MLSFAELKKLSKAIINYKEPIQFSASNEVITLNEMNDMLRDELAQKLGTYKDYRRNKLDYFELMEETIDEIIESVR